MVLESVIAVLRAHEPELRSSGIHRLTVFGSVARGEEHDESDIDVTVQLDTDAAQGGFAYYGRLARLRTRLTTLLGRPVDVVAEPVRRESLRRAIELEGAVAF